MKTLFVLCALVALVYGGEVAEYFNEGRCIGIRHKVPDVLRSSNDDWWVPGKVSTYQVCCNEGFPSGTSINGYQWYLSADNCMRTVHNNFQQLSQRRSGCQFSWNVRYNPNRQNYKSG